MLADTFPPPSPPLHRFRRVLYHERHERFSCGSEVVGHVNAGMKLLEPVLLPATKFYTLFLSFPHAWNFSPSIFFFDIAFKKNAVVFCTIVKKKKKVPDTSQSFMNAVNRLIKISIYSATRQNKHRVSLSCSPVSLKVFGIKLKKHSFSLVFIICELRTIFFFGNCQSQNEECMKLTCSWLW